MPITASLGALSYSKVSLGDDYQYWFLRTTDNYSFRSTTIDPQNNLYVGSLTGRILKLNVSGTWPQTEWAVVIATSNFNNMRYITYNSSTDRIAFVSGYGSGTNYVLTGEIEKTFTGTVTNFYSYKYFSGPASENNIVGYVLAYNSTGTLALGGYAHPYNYSPGGYQFNNGAFLLGSNIGGAKFESGTTNTVTCACTGLVFSNDNYPVFLSYGPKTSVTGNSYYISVIGKSPLTPYSGTNLLYPNIWLNYFSLATTNLVSEKLIKDSSGNLYGLINGGSDAYIFKLDSSGSLQWQRKLTNTTLRGIVLGSSSNLYVTGNTSTSDTFIAEYNTSGTIQWQTKFSGLTFTGYDVKYIGSNLYICGEATSKGFVLKVPNDGSIPGTGSYTGGLTYATASQTEGAGTLSYTSTDFSAAYRDFSTSVGSFTETATSIPRTITNL